MSCIFKVIRIGPDVNGLIFPLTKNMAELDEMQYIEIIGTGSL